MISFARFMELALYCPDCGYYEKEDDNIGRRGDFYTSVSVGPLYGELLAFQFAEWLAELPGELLQIVEAGAHDGRLALDILRWLQQWRPEVFNRVEYIVCETSQRRRRWQEKMLADFAGRVQWLDDGLSQRAKSFRGLIFCNELLDAMPVHRLGWDAERREWFEWGVVLKGDGFDWARLEQVQVPASASSVHQWLAELPDEMLACLPEGFTMEVCPTAEQWWHDASMALQQGRLLALDYGWMGDDFFAPHRARGTLRAYHRHKPADDIFASPGEQDITAHVNFSVIQATGESAGLKTQLFTTQAEFFVGILRQFWPESERQGGWTGARSRQFQTLVHPEHLGRAFRVLLQSR